MEKTWWRQPSAVIPIAMSVAALGTVLVQLAVHGPAPQADEGTAAHIWQMLMAGQAPVVGYYVIKWLPRMGRRAATVLAMQAGAAIAAMAPVWWFGW